MNVKSAIAAIATISATLGVSANAFAGELYDGLETSAGQAGSPVASIIIEMPANTFGGGEIYTAANQALDSFEASQAPKATVVTTLAVGGELGAPATGTQVFPANTSLAE